ncbi:MAG: hypothetical protein EA382_09510 [Spirochaetaceae bacterium]|nr:MAG: hypothetical protein EA382_09510 [Spirochaetaceae bacterium]
MSRGTKTVALPILCVLVLIWTGSLSADPSPAIARLYVDAAHRAYVDGDSLRATHLLEPAFEFARSSSDLLFLSALIASERQETTAGAIELVRSALRSDTFGAYERLQALTLYGSLLNRTSRHALAADALSQARFTPRTASSTRSANERELVRALIGQRQTAAARRALDAARDRNPNDPELFRLQLSLETAATLNHRREVERFIRLPRDERQPGMIVDRVGGSQRADSALARLLLEYALIAPNAAERRWAVDRYLDSGGDDPVIATVLLGDDYAAAVDLFVALDGFRSLDAVDAVVNANSGVSARLSAAAMEFSGAAVRDADRDGFWEERVAVEGGLIVAFERDLRQDGVIDERITFRDGEVDTFEAVDEVVERTVRYGLYPFVESVRIRLPDSERHFVLRPRSLALRIVQQLPEGGPTILSGLSARDGVSVPVQSELERSATHVDDIRRDGTLERRFLEAGEVSFIARDSNGDGTWDHLLMAERGVPVSAVRDTNFDGRFDVTEGYRDGELVALAIDSTGDDAPDVFYGVDESAFVDWDLDGDGRIDVREYREWRGAVLRSFPLAGVNR